MRSVLISSALIMGLGIFSSSCFSSATINDDSVTFQVIQSQIIFNSSNTENAIVIKQQDNTYAVQIKLKPSAADELKHITKKGVGKVATLIFEGKVISIATIQGELGDVFLVTGLSKVEAEKIASSIKRPN